MSACSECAKEVRTAPDENGKTRAVELANGVCLVCFADYYGWCWRTGRNPSPTFSGETVALWRIATVKGL